MKLSINKEKLLNKNYYQNLPKMLSFMKKKMVDA